VKAGRSLRVASPTVLVAALALLSAACGRPGTPPGPPPNLLFLTLDTTRADHVCLSDAGRDTTPRLRALAQAGVRFDLAYAAASSTLPSHASLFTGLPPIAHGAVKNGLRLSDDVTTLAEVLRDHGWHTGAVVSSFVLDRRFGLAQGFSQYDDDLPPDEATSARGGWMGFDLQGGGFERRADFTTDRAIRWLDEHAARPFFLFVHYYDAHNPYVPPPPFDTRFARRAGDPRSLADELTHRDEIDAYDGEIAFVDAQLGRLLDHLAARGLADDTLVLVTADHGEGLGEHGAMHHAVNVYEEAIRVPLVMRWPGRLPAGAVVDQPVAAVDVMPTLLELLGLGAPAQPLAGGSLAGALLRGKRLPPDRPVFVHRRPYEPAFVDGTRVAGQLFAVRVGRWKWIEGTGDGTRELYDLDADPRETLNLASRKPERAAEFAQRVDSFRNEYQRTASAGTVSPADLDRLRALGYAE
jgi:arylsulfatase A-like enzyme